MVVWLQKGGCGFNLVFMMTLLLLASSMALASVWHILLPDMYMLTIYWPAHENLVHIADTKYGCSRRIRPRNLDLYSFRLRQYGRLLEVIAHMRYVPNSPCPVP